MSPPASPPSQPPPSLQPLPPPPKAPPPPLRPPPRSPPASPPSTPPSSPPHSPPPPPPPPLPSSPQPPSSPPISAPLPVLPHAPASPPPLSPPDSPSSQRSPSRQPSAPRSHYPLPSAQAPLPPSEKPLSPSPLLPPPAMPSSPIWPPHPNVPALLSLYPNPPTVSTPLHRPPTYSALPPLQSPSPTLYYSAAPPYPRGHLLGHSVPEAPPSPLLSEYHDLTTSFIVATASSRFASASWQAQFASRWGSLLSVEGVRVHVSVHAVGDRTRITATVPLPSTLTDPSSVIATISRQIGQHPTQVSLSTALDLNLTDEAMMTMGSRTVRLFSSTAQPPPPLVPPPHTPSGEGSGGFSTMAVSLLALLVSVLASIVLWYHGKSCMLLICGRCMKDMEGGREKAPPSVCRTSAGGNQAPHTMVGTASHVSGVGCGGPTPAIADGKELGPVRPSAPVIDVALDVKRKGWRRGSGLPTRSTSRKWSTDLGQREDLVDERRRGSLSVGKPPRQLRCKPGGARIDAEKRVVKTAHLAAMLRGSVLRQSGHRGHMHEGATLPEAAPCPGPAATHLAVNDGQGSIVEERLKTLKRQPLSSGRLVSRQGATDGWAGKSLPPQWSRRGSYTPGKVAKTVMSELRRSLSKDPNRIKI